MATYKGILQVKDKNGTMQNFYPRTTPGAVESALSNASLAADLIALNIIAQSAGDASNYLPLAGGQMTGDISRKNAAGTRTAYIAFNSADTAYNDFFVGWQGSGGSRLHLYSAEHATYPGWFRLRSNDGTDVSELVGAPSGTLTWGGKNVLTQGDMDAYLPLAGGTMTGAVTTKGIVSSQTAALYRNGDASYLDVFGGGSGSGARLRLSGPNRSGYEGTFFLIASDGTTSPQLVGKVDGTLTWAGTAIALSTDLANYLPLAGGTMTGNITSKAIIASQGAALYRSVDTSWIRISGGAADNTGARLLLYGPTVSGTNAGRFVLTAGDSSTSKGLDGRPDGTLLWNGTAVAVGSFLPLSGGTVTGAITSTSDNIAFTAAPSGSNYELSFGVGSGGSNRGIYQGKQSGSVLVNWLLYWNSAGTFYLRTDNAGAVGPTLQGTAAGALTWNGNTVLTSASTVAAAKVSGTVSAATTGTKLNGQTSTSGSTSSTVSVAFKQETTANFVLPSGGTWVVLRFMRNATVSAGMLARVATAAGGATIYHANDNSDTTSGSSGFYNMSMFAVRVG